MLMEEPDETSKAEITFFADHVNVFFGKNVNRSLLYYIIANSLLAMMQSTMFKMSEIYHYT